MELAEERRLKVEAWRLIEQRDAELTGVVQSLNTVEDELGAKEKRIVSLADDLRHKEAEVEALKARLQQVQAGEGNETDDEQDLFTENFKLKGELEAVMGELSEARADVKAKVVRAAGY